MYGLTQTRHQNTYNNTFNLYYDKTRTSLWKNGCIIYKCHLPFMLFLGMAHILKSLWKLIGTYIRQPCYVHCHIRHWSIPKEWLVRAQTKSLTCHFFIEIPVPSQERERLMYLCVSGIDYALFYDFSVGFWNCSHNMFFFIINWCFSLFL
jgi:hypothetical protein